MGHCRQPRRHSLRGGVLRRDRGDQWPGSRVISAQKANTANAFSLPGLALSTANFTPRCSRAGHSTGCRQSNPVDTGAAYKGTTLKTSGIQRSARWARRSAGVKCSAAASACVTAQQVLVRRRWRQRRHLVRRSRHRVATQNNLNLDFVPAEPEPRARRTTSTLKVPFLCGACRTTAGVRPCPIAGVDTASANFGRSAQRGVAGFHPPDAEDGQWELAARRLWYRPPVDRGRTGPGSARGRGGVIVNVLGS